MTVNPNVPPPNGYVFRDTDGTLLKATSWKALERKVIAYRNQVGGNVDNVLKEIIQQVCAATPDYCKHPGDRSNGSNRDMGKDHKQKLIQYLAMIVNAKEAKSLRYVQDSEAQNRAKICAGCPHRQHIDIGCQSCKNSVANLREKCLDGKKSRAPALGICDYSKCDLAVAIHVCENLENDGRLPHYCWRKA